MTAKYTLAGLGLTMGLAVAAATAPAPAPTTRLAKTGATINGICVSLVTLLIGAALATAGHIINRRFTK